MANLCYLSNLWVNFSLARETTEFGGPLPRNDDGELRWLPHRE